MSSMAHGRMGNAPNGRGGGTQGPVLVVNRRCAFGGVVMELCVTRRFMAAHHLGESACRRQACARWSLSVCLGVHLPGRACD